MFASKFTKRNTSLFSDQDFNANKIYGSTKQGRFRNGQERNQDQADSISIGPRQQPVSRRSSDYQRPSRTTYNKRTNLNTTKKQTAVRPADSQIYQRNILRNANSIQPEIIGTNTFQPAPKSQIDSSSHSPRNLSINNGRRLSNASEHPSEQSSSFCIINQGNLPKSIGLDDFRRPEFSLFSPEPDPASNVIDYCVYCVNKQKFVPATHHCISCGPFGRYLCQTCLGQHNVFREDHKVQSLSGQSYKKQNEETNVKSVKETETFDTPNKGQQNHQSFIRDVSVKTENDYQSCQITGFCQIKNGTIVLTEMNNKAIKTLDSGTYQVTSTHQLSEYPMDICCMDGNDALVILYKSTIQYIRIDPDDHIQLTRKKVLEHDCICLAYSNQKIYVGSSKCLYIYDTKWTEIDKITNELFGDELFSNGFSITVSELDNGMTIYVADENNGMCSFQITGQEITNTWKFKDCNAFKAAGMCFDGSKNVLLCDKGTERLIKMNGEGMIQSILLDSSWEIQPFNIPFYDKKNNNVLISLSGKDFIKVFNFNT